MMNPDPPPVQLLRMLYGSLLANLISSVAEIGVADLLIGGPRSAEELAGQTGTDPDALYRALRALSAASVFAEVEPRRFALTPLAATLRTGVPGSMRDHARNWGMPEYQRAFTELGHCLRTGRPGFDHAFGTDWWSYLAEHPRQAEAFNRAMGNRANQIAVAAAEGCNLSDVTWLVDVGGGHGQLAASLLDRWPTLTATVFDRPDMVGGAAELLAGYPGRAHTVAGDFFDSVPSGADAYLLSSVLHDWNDTDATAILRSVRKAMKPDGKVVLVEMMIADGEAGMVGAMLDIVMLALVGGRERTEAEFRALLAGAGLRHVETLPTASPASLLIAVPK
jgi:SAM-dependent methyltransferase